MGIQESWGARLRTLPTGPRNLITDVAGVTVGHATLHSGDIHTGVTALLPHGGDLFHRKVPAAAHVINGYGKSVGLVQVAELGSVETPIFLTNTLSVGTVSTTCVRHMLESCPDIGRGAGTVNPVVMECNDGTLSDIRALAVRESDALAALEAAGEDFAEGAVGAGTGMVCYDLKGGIGSSSRLAETQGRSYTVGALALTNFGSLADLTVAGTPVGRQYKEALPSRPDQGSCILILATDAPLTHRQLGRLARRAQSGLARTGSYTGHGSGEIALAFSTANLIPHAAPGAPMAGEWLHDACLDPLFHAAVEGVEESILSSMAHAAPLTGRGGRECPSLAQVLEAVGGF